MNSGNHFEAIVCAHYQPLFKFALSLTRAESDAWDLTQQTFYLWATKGHQLRDLAKVKSWLFTTLHRAFLVARRKQSRFGSHTLDEVTEEWPTLSPEFVGQADCPQVLRALARLDDIYQTAVALFYLEDCSYKQIAAILGIPVGTVKSRIARGILQLRKILGFAEPEAEAAGTTPRRDAEVSKRDSPDEACASERTFQEDAVTQTAS